MAAHQKREDVKRCLILPLLQEVEKASVKTIDPRTNLQHAVE